MPFAFPLSLASLTLRSDYIFLQPIYSVPQRTTLWEMEGGFTDKKTWMVLMDEVIRRENLPGNTAQKPKKKVQIMVCACFEDTGSPEEKIFYWSPKPIDDLPHFRLCHRVYWEEARAKANVFQSVEQRPEELRLRDVVLELQTLTK